MHLLHLPDHILILIFSFCQCSDIYQLRRVSFINGSLIAILNHCEATLQKKTLEYWKSIQKNEIKKRLERETKNLTEKIKNTPFPFVSNNRNLLYLECIHFNSSLIKQLPFLNIESILDKNYLEAERWKNDNFELYFDKTKLLEYAMME